MRLESKKMHLVLLFSSSLLLEAYAFADHDPFEKSLPLVFGGEATSVEVAANKHSKKVSKKRSSTEPKKSNGIAIDELLSAQPMTFGQLSLLAAGTTTTYENELPTVLPAETVVQRKKAAPQITVNATPEKTAVVRISEIGAPVAKISLASSTAVKPAEVKNVTSAMVLQIVEKNGELMFMPQTLHFAAVGGKAKVELGIPEVGLSIFVRDQSTLEWDSAAKNLTARAQGITEVYVVSKGKMYIVPVVVDDKKDSWNIEVPDALVSLDGVFSKSLGKLSSAIFPDMVTASRASTTATTATNDPDVETSVLDTQKSLEQQASLAAVNARYQAKAASLAYKTVTLQLIDERSNLAAKIIYPLNNMRVSLIGTEFVGVTDATGHLSIRDMPSDSRFLLSYEDPEGRVRSGLVELNTGGTSISKGVMHFKAMREFTFDAFTRIAGIVQDAGFGSVCGAVVTEDQSVTPSGFVVSTDVSADGPYYFDKYGFLDRAMASTGEDGRFCFFNIAPGPVALNLFEADAFVATLPLSIFAGRHTEEVLDLSQTRSITTMLAAMPTAHEQLGSDTLAANTYKAIDMIDLIPLGNPVPMMQLAAGKVVTPDERAVLPLHGRAYALSQAAEFESVLYGYNVNNGDSEPYVTPLVPRGFVEDMALYAQVSYDPLLGVVLVEHGAFKGQEHNSVNMRLLDQFGRDVGDGWYYSDAPSTRAVFFNIPAGTYTLIVETAEKYWLAAETVIVYNETVSYVRTGSSLRYRP